MWARAPIRACSRQQRRRDTTCRRIGRRQAHADDFATYEWVLAMDRDNLAALAQLRGSKGVRPELFLPWSGVRSPLEFPDPYFGEAEGFCEAVRLAEQGVDGLIARLRGG